MINPKVIITLDYLRKERVSKLKIDREIVAVKIETLKEELAQLERDNQINKEQIEVYREKGWNVEELEKVTQEELGDNIHLYYLIIEDMEREYQRIQTHIDQLVHDSKMTVKIVKEKH